MASHSHIPMLMVLMVLFINAVYGDSNNEINWGSQTSNCQTQTAEYPKSSVTVRSPSSGKPIVGIFATRYDLSNNVWGTGKIMGTKMAMKRCYGAGLAYYSVVGGTTKAPTAVDITVGTSSPEYCSYGYNVKVCFKN